MQVEQHPLSIEFPEFKEQIHALKLSDLHFSKLFDAYSDADKAVNRAENGQENLGDAELETLKKERVQLKDELYALLKAAQG
jgi:uncharacterized protein YdcH (DUF465 family)